MFLRRMRSLLVVLFPASVIALSLKAQIPVEGVADQQIYNSSVSLRVPAEAGYSYAVWLDGRPVPVDVSVAVNQVDYHELVVERTTVDTGSVTRQLVRFIVQAPEREGSETGLPVWVPYPMISSTAAEFAGARLRVIAPQEYPLGLQIPVVIWVENEEGHAVRVNGLVAADGHPSIEIRRGVGSGFLASTHPAGLVDYTARIGGLETNRAITLESSTAWTVVSGFLSGPVEWPANSRISVEGHLTVQNNSSLTIGAGTVVRLNAGIDITNFGLVTINGTVDRPVVFTPRLPGQPWGGFNLRAASPNAGSLVATGTIFTGSGSNQTWFGSGGNPGSHRREQALFFAPTTNVVTMVDCAAISLAGQLGHSVNGGAFTFTRFLMQRCTSGGEYSGSSAPLLFRVNDSAFIECPNDTPNFVNGDNDALYLVHGTHGFTNTLFGWTKDDGIDCGGSGRGLLEFERCWFESMFHEGTSLSGTGKDVFHHNGVLLNSGQPVECGYEAPTSRVDRCLILANLTGVRYGDNYTGSTGTGFKNGSVGLTNSILLHNHRDVWGQVWTTDWYYRTNRMDVHDNFLTVPNPYHPNNAVWDPAVDGWRLAQFMTTPPEAPVGVGLAVWSSPLAMSNIFQGIPVRLSTFTTNTVRVHYMFRAVDEPLFEGTVSFAPGETVKRIYPAGFQASDNPSVELVLVGAEGGELTGRTNVVYQGSVGVPVVSLAVGAVSQPMVRLTEGPFVRLSGPSALAVRVNYRFESGGQTLESGTLVVEPLATLARLYLTEAAPYDYEQIVLTLSDPIWATLGGVTSVTYVNPPLTMGLAVGGAQQELAAFGAGVPVGLSRPAPSGGVSTDFVVEGGGGVLTNGTLELAGGESAKAIMAPTVGWEGYDVLRVRLINPVRASYSGLTNVYYVRTVSAPEVTNQTFVARGAEWKYLDTGTNAGTAWRELGYEDSGWGSGPAELGYGNGDEATVVSYGPNSGAKYVTTYFRRVFEVEDPGAYESLTMGLKYDDGGVVYVNGVEVYRTTTMPAAPTVITYQTYTVGNTVDNAEASATLGAGVLQAGANVVAVEIHQRNGTSSDISFDLELIGVARPLPAPPQDVYWGEFGGGDWVLAWGDPSFYLQQASSVTGPWSMMIGRRSPTVITPVPGPPKFYRLYKP